MTQAIVRKQIYNTYAGELDAINASEATKQELKEMLDAGTLTKSAADVAM